MWGEAKCGRHEIYPGRGMEVFGEIQRIAVLPVIDRLAAHLHPGSEFRDAAGGLDSGELLQPGHKCRIILDLRSRFVQDRQDVNPFLPGFLEHSQQAVRIRNVDLLHQYGDIASRQHRRIK